MSNISCNVIAVPGPPGRDASAATNGTNGANSYGTLTAAFTMPGYGAEAEATIDDNGWPTPGQYVQIGLSVLQVTAKSGTTKVTLKNPAAAGGAAYPDNQPPTFVFVAGNPISPAGQQGVAGSLTGTAGGDLKGIYPNAKLAIPNTLGDLAAGNGTDAAALSTGGAGSNGKILHADSTEALGLRWHSLDLTGADTVLSGVLPVASGGTGGANAAAARTALGAAAKGANSDITSLTGITTPLAAAYGGTGVASLAALITALGLGPYMRYGLLGSISVADFNTTADQSIVMAASAYILRRIIVENASVNLTTAQGGIYTQAAKAGTALVASTQAYTALTAAAKFLDLTLEAVCGTDVRTEATLYFSLTTAQGVAATARLWVFGEKIA